MPKALIADDEPLLRERLERLLAVAWPELELRHRARNGREAIELFDAEAVDLAFLDVHMPGRNGIEVAQALQGRCEIVFVTAFDRYALQAFEQGALDYLLKPVQAPRLAETVQRLKSRLGASAAAPALAPSSSSSSAPAGLSAESTGAPPAPWLEALAAQIRAQTAATSAPRYLQWIRASIGNTLKLIPVDEVLYLRSDEKYTSVVHTDGEALIRRSLRELLDELDPQRFVQTHRSVVVNLHAVDKLVRSDNETADVHLRGRSEVLPVSRSYLPFFRQM